MILFGYYVYFRGTAKNLQLKGKTVWLVGISKNTSL